MTDQWEYRVTNNSRSIGLLEHWLNGIGQHGWELVTLTFIGSTWVATFKRRKTGIDNGSKG